MIDETKPQDPPEGGQSTTTTQDPPEQGGQSTTQDAQDQVPEKFKGKSAGDIAKSYIELEKKLGESAKTTSEAKQYREQLAQWEQLGAILESDPALFKIVEDKIKTAKGQKNDSDTKDQAPDNSDIRASQTNIVINSFEEKYGIDKLTSETRTDIQGKIAQELAEMLDPGGKKPVKDVLSSIPLTRLPNYLEKAYRLATIDNREEQARLQGLLQARQNNEAAFGNSLSSSVSGSKGQLTEDEKTVARKQGISEEDYLKQKEIIEKQN